MCFLLGFSLGSSQWNMQIRSIGNAELAVGVSGCVSAGIDW